MKNNFNKAFTLVELIVVITILAVLATVGFISLTGYATESRDTKRMTDIATISKGLQVYLTKNSQVPEPSETKTTVSYSGSQLLTQGYAGESVLNEIRVQDAKDPRDNIFYTYSTNANNTKFQLLALLEKQIAKNNYLLSSLFANYSDRIIYTKGNIVGIMLNENNIPVQELGNGIIDLISDSNNYIVSFGNENRVISSGALLYSEIIGSINATDSQQNTTNFDDWRSIDTNCDKPDIIIGGQTWAGCNSTLGGGYEFGQMSREIGTDGYTASINNCYDYDGNDIASCIKGDITMASNTKANTWFTGQNSNFDTEFGNIWGKLYTWDSASVACSSGYRVPTVNDWEILETYLNQGVNCRNNTDGWICPGLGWMGHNFKTSTNNLANALQIPLSGYTYIGSFGNRGSNAYLWTSNENVSNGQGYFMNLNSGYDTVLRYSYPKLYGFSVRCIKD